ncbi:RloB domain-containing protein [Actinomadura bangladeshensis]|uniref:RloB domain-containing protein n=1 Tax=Actinomadura bangladeshensis TaxID=453573 RepID=A0A4R4NCW5_9ACTN|nr:RloB domain-containing protein [Actinomadura bangladeshensis]
MTSKGKNRKRGAPARSTSSRPRDQYGQNRRSLVVTVVCEGKTERDYLSCLNDEAGQEGRFFINLAPASQPNQGFKPEKAVQQAIEAKKQLPAADKKQVWVVFDRDENTDIPRAFRLADVHNIEVAFSAPSFDLWLWLHFAPGLPSQSSNDQILRSLNAVAGFEYYGKRSGGKSSNSNPKRLNDKQRSVLWGKRVDAVRLARKLVDRCWEGHCEAKQKPAESGHADNCDPLRRDTQTDFYRLMELLRVADRSERRHRRSS